MQHVSRRDKVALLSKRLGLTSCMEYLKKKPCLLVLNYHRVGDAETCRYDPGVFSATGEAFYDQVEYLRKHCHVAELDEVVETIEGGTGACKRPMVLITFDDGYLDNYEVAFPILKDLGVQATFFLPTSYIGTDAVPWWDQIAYAIRNTRKSRIHVENHETELSLSSAERNESLRKVLKLYKSPSNINPDLFISKLFDECDVPAVQEKSDRLFMSWDEARAMVDGGMAIGSHTHSHKILSKLSFEDQVYELETSKAMLNARLGIQVKTLAYPVGARHAFSRDTQLALSETGYSAAFSFYGGVNLPQKTARYDVLRVGIENGLQDYRFRFQLNVAGLAGVWV